MITQEAVFTALAGVMDPEIGKPITDLGMVPAVHIDAGHVIVEVKLTVPGCPLKDKITHDVTAAVGALAGVERVEVRFDSMTTEERTALTARLRAENGQAPQQSIPFAQADNKTTVIAIASGKGGVGKSSVTVNLAVALADEGHEVGVLDADIYGYSIPRMLGVSGRPVAFEGMVMPLQGYGCKVVSIGFFMPDPDKPVIWRGPMLHRALQQFLGDVYWGDLDFLLCDLPPGTGDIAISLAQMLPNADMVLVTTPQEAAERVAVRAGMMTEQAGMKVRGVIENMASFTCPDCGSTHEIFGSGGGAALAAELGAELLGRVPIDPRLREGGDAGKPLVLSDPDVPASLELRAIAQKLIARRSSPIGKRLPLAVSPTA